MTNSKTLFILKKFFHKWRFIYHKDFSVEEKKRQLNYISRNTKIGSYVTFYDKGWVKMNNSFLNHQQTTLNRYDTLILSGDASLHIS